MVNWQDTDIKQFKKQARKTQQVYCDLLGNREWDVIGDREWSVLRRKVGFGMYGPPSATPTEANRNTGYKKKQLDEIEKICDQLIETLNFYRRKIHFACIFVLVKVHDKRYTVPVFKGKRPKQSSSECVFVDMNARKYSSWQDYLDNNTLEKCIFCYPKYGKYKNDSDNDVRISFDTSPACNFSSRLFGAFDTASSTMSVVTATIGLASLAVPIAGPVLAATTIVGASTSAYGFTRSTYALIDRAAHNQSIDLSDAEARGCWLSIVGSSLGFAQGRMITRLQDVARAGDVAAKAGQIAFMVVQTGKLTTSGISVVYNLADLVDKQERGELTPKDVYQFSTSILFFANAAVKVTTANNIIKEMQTKIIERHRGGLSRGARQAFDDEMARLCNPDDDEVHRNAATVRYLNHIENSRELFEMLTYNTPPDTSDTESD